MTLHTRPRRPRWQSRLTTRGLLNMLEQSRKQSLEKNFSTESETMCVCHRTPRKSPRKTPHYEAARRGAKTALHCSVQVITNGGGFSFFCSNDFLILGTYNRGLPIKIILLYAGWLILLYSKSWVGTKYCRAWPTR
jgi:hypothetical protein